MLNTSKYRPILHWRTLILLQLLLLCGTFLHAQTYSTKGTDFWLGFMDNLNSDDTDNPIELHVYISADAAASGTVSVAGSSYSENFSVGAGSTVDVIVPAGLALATVAEIVEQRGVHVTSDVPVTVYLLNYKKTSSDAAIVFPSNTLGNTYLATSFASFDGINPSEIMIVAIADSTDLQIIPSDLTLGGASAGAPINVYLNRGETYLLQSFGDLSGTRISNHPTAIVCRNFAVFAGNKCTYVPNSCGFCDHLVQQMIPLTGWGRNFVTIPLETRFGDLYRIMASDDGTVVNFGSGASFILNSGQYYDTLLFIEEVITADGPISVAQYSRGGTCDGTLTADPFMILLNPIEQRMQELTFNSFTSSLISQYFLNLLVPTSSVGAITLDGVALPVSSFLPVGDLPDFSFAQLNISPGNHRLESTEGMSAYVYGYGDFESYGYVAGTNLLNLAQSFSILYDGDSAAYYNFYETIDCSNLLTVTLDPQPGYTYDWLFGDGTLASGSTASHLYTEGGDFEVVLIAFNPANCSADTIRWPIVVDGLNHGLPEDTTLCEGNSINLTVADLDLDVVWFDGSTGSSLLVEETGVYSFTLSNGICSSLDSITVGDALPAILDLPDNPIVCEAELVSLFLSPGEFDLVTWEDGTHTNPREITSEGLYSIEAINAYGCSVFAEFMVEELCGIQLFVPNAFSPDGDGLNDLFGVNSIYLNSIELRVFSRWGTLLFQSTTPATKWDGTFQGKAAEAGTYIWQARFSDINFPEKERIQAGTVTLLR